jgi:DnaJ-class molecular chaperone
MITKEACPLCHGKGWIELGCAKEDEARTCGLCHGTGATPIGGSCRACHGTGRIEVRTVEQQKCARCEGTGRYPIPESL